MDRWLSSKQRGRDDDQIGRDAKRAADDRLRRKRGKQQPPPATASGRKAAAAPKLAAAAPGKGKGGSGGGRSFGRDIGPNRKAPRRDDDYEDDDDDDDDDQDESSGYDDEEGPNAGEDEDDEEDFNEEDEESEDADDDLDLHDKDDESGDDDDEIEDDSVEVVEPIKARNPNRSTAFSREGSATTTATTKSHGSGNQKIAPATATNGDEDGAPSSDDTGGGLMDSSPLFGNGGVRSSVPSKLLARNARAAGGRRNNPTLAATKLQHDDRTRRSTQDSLSKLTSSVPAIKISSKRPAASPAEQRGSGSNRGWSNGGSLHTTSKRAKPGGDDDVHVLLGSSSDEDDDPTVTRLKKPPPTTAKGATSRFFNGKGNSGNPYSHRQTETIEIQSDEAPGPAGNLEDTPEPSRQTKKIRKLKKYNNRTKREENRIASNSHSMDPNDSMDSDNQLEEAIQRNPQGSAGDDDSLIDEDEKKLLMKVMKASKKTAAKEMQARCEPNDGEEVASVQTIHDESSEEDDDGPDEEYSQDKEVAMTVLKATELLSAQVVAAMKNWISQKGEDDGDDGGDGGDSKILQGIIVDGAVSLGNLDAMASTDVDAQEWNSNDTMKKACPNVTLSTYQLIGVNWLALLHGMRCNVGQQDTNVNGVLADEMGLGKTVQTIAFFAWLKYRQAKHVINLEAGPATGEDIVLPHLIVVPVSVLPNWMREFETFCPTMNVMKFYGSQQERDELKEELRAHHPKYRSKTRPPKRQLDVILTPVTYFQKESSSDRKFLAGFKYDYLVCDEAHMLKNASTARYKMLDKLQTQHRLLLTGTPVQNSPQELLNMLSFIMPLFSKSSYSFDEEKGNYSEQMLKHFVDQNLENGDEQEAYKKLKQLFAPFVLRRKKSDVIAQILPPKEQKVEFVTLDDSARAVYQSILEAHVQKVGKKVTAAIGDHLFTNLRKAAHHQLLLRNRHTSSEEVEHLISCFYKYGAFQGEGCTKTRVGEELSRFNDFHIHLTALELIQQNPHRRVDLDRYILNEEDLFCSAKFTRLRALLPELVSRGHRILIFSSWTSCLDLLGCLMEHLNLEFLRMDGSCPSDERQRLIDQFNAESTYSIFLLSTKACGLGINLTSADTCIIHDLDFNPFNDLQAQDRCHRRGQTKKVTVYKLVSCDTVDSDIYKMQEKKAKMNAAIMDSSNKNIKKELLQAAVDRFLTSPDGETVRPDAASKENMEDDEIIL